MMVLSILTADHHVTLYQGSRASSQNIPTYFDSSLPEKSCVEVERALVVAPIMRKVDGTFEAISDLNITFDKFSIDFRDIVLVDQRVIWQLQNAH
jgi:hypothetical protein